MPYKLRKAPNKPLYWVITIETGKKHSKDPIPIEKAKAQMRILESALKGAGFQFRKEGAEYVIFDEETDQIIKRVNTPSEALHLLKLYRKQGLPKFEKVYEPMEGEEEEVQEGADVTADADQQYRTELKNLLNALAPGGIINHQTLFQNLQPFLDKSKPGRAFLIRLFPYLMKVSSDAELYDLVEPMAKLINDLEYYLRTPIQKQKAYVEFMSGSGKRKCKKCGLPR